MGELAVPPIAASSKRWSATKGYEWAAELQHVFRSLAFIVNLTCGVCTDVLKIILGQLLRCLWFVFFPKSDRYVKKKPTKYC